MIKQASQAPPPPIEPENLLDTVAAQALIIQEMGEHLAILRTGILYMMLQAEMDEVDQTEAGNPWKKMRKDFAALLNPHIKKLNAMLGVKAPDIEKPKSVVVATK